ncbi:uncharacterized protein LOC127799346 [Diospyros lotus]|uniref:uncharacterized protein LOC127799346 n=1 Tax=Diospyros lotus TaxID=55363 RepID=UPI0022572504|nr:uncharacterized protein LOC127799346 [Diospyros lotus]XP_052189256.1 uncharacterized protein LOC127799346 [Diospyros lotus]
MGEVILGMPGPWADCKHEASDHYTTKIGGLPDWPIPNTALRCDLLLCSACGSKLCLVMQAYAPVSSKTLTIEERVLYIFGCVMPKCGGSPGSWRAIRVQKSFSGGKSSVNYHEEIAPTTSSLSASASDWREDLWAFDSIEDEDAGNDDIDLEELRRALSDAASLASYPKKQNKVHQSETIVEAAPVRKTTQEVDNQTPVLPCFYMYTQEEALCREVTFLSSSYTSLSIKEAKNDLDYNPQEEKWDKEAYEYDKALSADRTYLKFKKRMDAYPEQCFRYSFGGKPLLATGAAVDPGICSLCGGSRHYEMQLMPPLLYFLQEEALDSEDYSLENWDWMTVIVYTCSMSCSQPSQQNSNADGWIIAEEAVTIQYEELLPELIQHMWKSGL